MDPRTGNMFTIFNGYKQFVIPVYQRIYSWEKEQCSRLWDDIVEMQKAGKKTHFVGSIVNISETAMPVGIQKYTIIDGQQRMTTLTLLILALRDYIELHPDTSVSVDTINSMLLVNECEKKGDDRYKIFLTESDRNLLIDLIEKRPIPDTVHSRLVANYKFFAGKIASLELKPYAVYEAVGKLQIVNITLDRTLDDAQAIFESLNSTGKELSESDLIRNFVLMGLPPREQTHVYENIWRPMEKLFDYEKRGDVMDAFFRAYLTMKLARIPKVDQVYETFKSYRRNGGFSKTEDLCNDLLTYARYYTDMVFVRSSSKELRALYADIRELRMDVVYPFLLKVHSDAADGLISQNDLIEIIKLCISYVLRRGVCDMPTNSLNKTFATLRNAIRKNDYVNSIKAFFVLRDDYKEFPDDSKFTKAFVSRDVYNMRSRNFILSHLENFNNKGPITIENFTIEHIMPQNSNLRPEWQTMLGPDWREVQKTYLHTIGNLTLTAYNSEMSDKPFVNSTNPDDSKMDMEGGFKKSALRLNSYVVTQTTWNEKCIKERADRLAETAKKIWAYPKLSDKELAPYLTNNAGGKKYSLDTYDFNETNKNLFDILDKRIRNISPDVKREFKKLYIAYKLDTNFVDIIVQKARLRLSLNMKFSEVRDPKNMCTDISDLGRWGNGDVEVSFEHLSDIDDVMDLIEQSYQKQADE